MWSARAAALWQGSAEPVVGLGEERQRVLVDEFEPVVAHVGHTGLRIVADDDPRRDVGPPSSGLYLGMGESWCRSISSPVSTFSWTGPVSRVTGGTGLARPVRILSNTSSSVDLKAISAWRGSCRRRPPVGTGCRCRGTSARVRQSHRSLRSALATSRSRAMCRFTSTSSPSAQRGQEFAKVLVCRVIASGGGEDEHDDSDRTQQSVPAGDPRSVRYRWNVEGGHGILGG